jgi:cytochrome b6-f complex iron-sulfur subunit
MNRKEFLSTLGLSAAAIACAQCFGGCSSAADITGPTNVDFTLDLSTPAYQSLANAGGYAYKDGVIVAHVTGGSYVAVSAACTHAGSTVAYDASANDFHCPAHGSNFATDGRVINGPAGSPLTRYTTSLNGSLLRVTS